MSISISKRWVIFAAVVSIISVGIIFRFYNLDKKVYWSDEVVTTKILGGFSNDSVALFLKGDAVTVDYLKSSFAIPGHLDFGAIVERIGRGYIQNTPLYYFLLQIWVTLFGDSVHTLRLFSAVASLLTLPLIYWLAMEMFSDRRLAVLAALFLAISPIQLLYAQEARPYSLWVLTILFSCASFMTAIRLKTVGSWALYSISLVFLLYAHILSGLVIIGHGLYFFVAERNGKPGELLRYAGATLLAIVSFVPWLVFLTRRTTLYSFQDYTVHAIPFLDLISMFLMSVVKCFFDMKWPYGNSHFYYPLSLAFGGALVAYALYFYIRMIRDDKRSFLALALIAGSLGLPLFIDVLFGGCRAAAPRYLVPGLLAIELVVVYCMARQIFSNSRWRRLIWQYIFGLSFIVALSSCILICQADTWWSKGQDQDAPTIARCITAASPFLIVLPRAEADRALPLSLLLHSGGYLKLSNEGDLVMYGKDFGEVYLLKPAREFIKKLASNGYAAVPVPPSQIDLWRIARRPSIASQ